MLLMVILTTVHLAKTEQSSQEGYTRYPFPYKVTVYRSNKPARSNNANMQYAPLFFKPPATNYDSSTVNSKYDETSRKYEDSQLEPQYNEEYRPSKSFMPGYNFEFDSERNQDKEINKKDAIKNENHLPHNLEYNTEKEKSSIPFKMYNFQHNVISIPKDTPKEYTYKEEILNKNKIQGSDQRYPKNLLDLESNVIQPYFVVKTPRLHLNVARAYNFAFIPHKAPPHINELLLVRKVPSQHEQNFHKTFLASHPRNNCQTPGPY